MLSHLASKAAPTGAERVLAEVAVGLERRGHEVRLSVPGPWALGEKVRGLGVEVAEHPLRMCWLAQQRPQPLPMQLARWLRFAAPDRRARALRRWLAALRPDVVHVNCLPHLRGAAEAHRLGLPVCWHLHEILPPGLRRRWLAGRVRRDADRVVVVSEAAAGWLREEGLGERVRVVYNGVEPGPSRDRDAARKAEGFEKDMVAVVFVGQLMPHKGALDLVAAVHRMAARGQRVQTVLVGGGPEAVRRCLVAAAAAGPAASAVRVLPPRPEVDRLLVAADVVVVPSRWPDPLPRVVMEAMAAARPVVATAVGGIPEMVVDGATGMLVPPEDPDALAAALTRLTGDGGLRARMGHAGRERALERFTLARQVREVERVLAETVSAAAT